MDVLLSGNVAIPLLLQFFPCLEDFGDYFLQFLLQLINSKLFNYHTDKGCFKDISLELFNSVPLKQSYILLHETTLPKSMSITTTTSIEVCHYDHHFCYYTFPDS